MDFDELRPLPPDAREVMRLTIRAYITADGHQSYLVTTTGTDSAAESLGLLAVAQHDLLHNLPD